MEDLSFINDLPPAERQSWLDGPALNPPKNAVSNFANPPNKNDLAYVFAIFTGVFCTLLIALKVFSRFHYFRKILVEDAIAVAALGVLGAYLWCMWTLALNTGAFVHQWDVRLKNLPHFLYYMNIGSVTHGIVMMLVKTSILIEWSRIFVPGGIRNRFWWTCYITAAITVVFYITSTFLNIFMCNPRQKSWDRTVPGMCLRIGTVYLVTSSMSLVSSVMIFILPQPVIWSLQMSTGKKLAIAALFSLGISACIAAAWNVYNCSRFSTSEDVTYTVSHIGIWCTVEQLCGFLILCLTTASKFLRESSWIRFLVSKCRNDSKSGPMYPQERSVSHRLSAPNRRRKQRTDASLFTDTDRADLLPLSTINVQTDISIRANSINAHQMDKTFAKTEFP
ncbi:unnamed protein product [Periconia digitata]|uniref:Rhodopsin domain-containing protein n=1 Tax=Periconia digitata TaxID=1303443 RepID=A0A9W4UXJ5_9PLEO|nr:unnamed protein product [Periconia digitata]